MAKIYQMAFELAGKLDSSFQSSFKNANDTMSRTRRELEELRNMQKGVDAGFKKGVLNQASYANAQAQIANQTTKLTGVQGRLLAAQNMQNEAKAGRDKYGNTAVKATAAAAVVFAKPMADAVEFESAMADVKKVVDFDTPQQFKEMGQDVMVLSQRIPLATEGLAAIVAAGGQSGIAKAELISFAESAAKMGVAFDITADTAGEMMAKWRTAFKMNQAEVVELADKINYLGNTTAASAPKISDVVRRIGPLGDIGGVASGEIAALGASMVGAGIETEVAATGIKNMILGLVAGEGATKRQGEAFAALGIDATDLAKRMQVDAKGAIVDVLKTISQLEKHEQASTLKDLFGSESLSAIAPLLGNLDNLQDNLNKVADKAKYTGSMEAEFAARSATTANAMQLTANSVKNVGINLGTVFLPAISEASTSVANMAGVLAAWAQANPETASTVATVTLGTLGLIAAVGALGWTYNFLKGSVGGGVEALIDMHKWLFVSANMTTGYTRAQAILNATMLGFPALWVVAGIAAVVAGGYLLYKNWDTIVAFMSGAWESLKSGAKAVFDFYVNFWMNLPANIAYGVGYAIGFMQTLPQRTSEFFSATYAAATGWITATVTDVGAWLSQLPERTIAAGVAFIASFDNFGEGAYTTVVGWINRIPDAVSNAISNAGQSVAGFWNNIKTNFSAGQAAGAGGAGLPGHADGGIFNKPHIAWFAEGNSAEAAIPINNSSRSLNLLEKTNQLMGNPLGVGRGGITLSAPFSPSISVTGGDSNTLENVQRMLDVYRAEYERRLQSILSDFQQQQARVGY